MKTFFKILTLLAITFLPKETKATHVMGSDILWKCLGNERYEISLKFYRDCNGIAFSNSKTIRFECVLGASGSVNVNLPVRTWRDITPSCAGVPNPCGTPGNTGGAGEGVEEHLYTTIIDFSTGAFKTLRDNGCCRFRLIFGECCRNGTITTGGRYANYSTDAEIDLCNIEKSVKKGCDDSPDLRNVPIGYLCCNQPFYFNNGVVDVDGDSLYFSLVACQSAQGVSVPYNAPFNPTTWPMTGFCRNGKGPCACRQRRPIEGICFDPLTGDLAFLPVDCDEVGILVIKVEQFRLDSTATNWLYIGYTKRDLQLQVVNCGNNNPPIFRDLSNPTVCEGERLCMTIIAEDEEFSGSQGIQPWKDTIDLTWNQGLPGATFTVGNPYFTFTNGVTVAVREVEICWQTKEGDGREAPYLFTVTARDKACPRNAVSSRGFAVRVKRTARAERLLKEGTCGRFYMHSIPEDSFWYKGNYFHDWTIRDSTNSGNPVFRSNRRTDSLQFLEGGKYILTYFINNPPLNCPSEYSDTFEIPPLLQAHLPSDTFVCEGDTVAVTLDIKNGTRPYRISWENPLGTLTSDTSKIIKIWTERDIKVSAKVIDSNGCTAGDTVFVKAVMNPEPFIGPDERICSYDTLFLKSNYPVDSIWKFHWSRSNLNADSAQNIWLQTPGMVYHKVIDTLGCWGIDSMELFVNEKVFSIPGQDRGVCIFDTVYFAANRLPLYFPGTYRWSRLTPERSIYISNDSVIMQRWNDTSSRRYELYVEVEEGGVICVDADTFNLTVWPLPLITFNPVSPKCFDYGTINLNSADGPRHSPPWLNFSHRKPGIVTGGPFPSAHFFQTDSFPGGITTWVVGDGSDSNGCYNIDSFQLRINPNPVVELDSGVFCQNANFGNTPATLSKIPLRLIERRVSLGAAKTWKILSAPQGVPTSSYDALIQNCGSPVNPDPCLDAGPIGPQKIGKYTIELCATNNLTNCRSCDTSTIEIVELPEVDISFIPNQCVNFDTLLLNNFVNLQNGRWYIKSGPPNFSDWIRDSSKFMPFRGPGAFELVFVHTASGCRVADSTNINVSPLPVIRLDTFSRVCNIDDSRLLRVNIPQNWTADGRWSGFGVARQGNDWFFNPGSSPAEKTFEGPYTLRFDYKQPITGCENFDTFRVTIQTKPEINILGQRPLGQCEFTTFTLSANTRFSNGIRWSSSGDGIITNETSLNTEYNHGVSDTANGFAWIGISTNPYGVCPSVSDSIQILIYAYPQIDFVGDPTSGCQPLTANFTSFVNKPPGRANLEYNWRFIKVNPAGQWEAKSDSADPQIQFREAGDYDVGLMVVNNIGRCTTDLLKEKYINVYPVPTAFFQTDPGYFTTLARPRFRMINGSKIEFGLLNYLWDFGTGDNGDTSTAISPTFVYQDKDTGEYLITLWAESENGCLDSTSQWIKIGPDVTVYIPNVFSPNKIGPLNNERFWVVANGITWFNLQIYNRWGELMYESDDQFEGWDGRFNRVDCHDGVYTYVVRVTGFDDKNYEFSGTVTLIR
jgi:gliding motility-associated-like protein